MIRKQDGGYRLAVPASTVDWYRFIDLVVPALDDEFVESTEGISAVVAAITTLLTGEAGAVVSATN